MRNETKLISDKAKADALTALVKAKQPRKKPCKECGFGKYTDKETNPATPKSKAGSKAESKEKAQTPTPPARESRRLSKSDTEDILMGCSATDVNNQYFVSVTARKVQFKKLLSAPTGSKADTVETAATVPDKAIRATFNKNTRDKITQALGKIAPTRAYQIFNRTEKHTTAQWFFKRGGYDITRIEGAPSDLNQDAIVDEGDEATIITVNLKKNVRNFVFLPTSQWEGTTRTPIGAKGAAKIIGWMRAIEQAVYDGTEAKDHKNSVILILEEDADPTRIIGMKCKEATTIDILWESFDESAKILALNPSPFQQVDKKNRPIWTATTSTTAVLMTLGAARTIADSMKFQTHDKEATCAVPLMPVVDAPRFATTGMIIAHIFKNQAFEVRNECQFSIPECAGEGASPYDGLRDTRLEEDWIEAHDNCQRITGLTDSYRLQLREFFGVDKNAVNSESEEEEKEASDDDSDQRDTPDGNEEKQERLEAEPPKPIEGIIKMTPESDQKYLGIQYILSNKYVAVEGQASRELRAMATKLTESAERSFTPMNTVPGVTTSLLKYPIAHAGSSTTLETSSLRAGFETTETYTVFENSLTDLDRAMGSVFKWLCDARSYSKTATTRSA
jgi:hypothetical protein